MRLSDFFSNKKIIKYTPDYRDTILYNGVDIYTGTGRIIDDKIEFRKEDNPDELVYFNTNLSADQYIEYHNHFDIIRNKDCSDFGNTGMFLNSTDAHGNYYPTGRIFRQDTGQNSWEIMRLNDPDDVIYFQLPVSEQDMIIGPNALKHDIISTTKYVEFTEEATNEWNKTVRLAVDAKRAGNYVESLRIWEEFEKKYPALNPSLSVGKGKVLILLNRLEDAKMEFLKCIDYFVRNESQILYSADELTKNNIIGAIGHIGFCVGKWEDEKNYLARLVGKKVEYNQYYAGLRVLAGLDKINENGLWCKTFDLMKFNVETSK